MRSAGRLGLLGLGLAAAVIAGCTDGAGGTGATAAPGGDGATGQPVTDLSRLCDLLGPGDFAAAGIQGAGPPTVSSDGPGTAYCVYAGESAATGGIEFDAFVGEDATDTFDVIVAEAGADLTDIPIPGVDAAKATDGVAGQVDKFATIVVRKGNLAFTISAPGGPGNSARLVALVGIVLARATGLTG